jgi:hypothetical protein
MSADIVEASSRSEGGIRAADAKLHGNSRLDGLKLGEEEFHELPILAHVDTAGYDRRRDESGFVSGLWTVVDVEGVEAEMAVCSKLSGVNIWMGNLDERVDKVTRRCRS